MAERKPFLLRLDEATYDALKTWADDELRSVNAQIEFLLRRAIDAAGRARDQESRPPRSPVREAQLSSGTRAAGPRR
jgi:hypothetical protein